MPAEYADRKDGADDLDRRIGRREGKPALLERLRQRARPRQARQHQDHKGEPDRQSVGIEIVGEPGRVVPARSDGEEEQEAGVGAWSR
jgi:hypothetical protein